MSLQFLLDTDTVSFALRRHSRVNAAILEHYPARLAISAVTLYELRFGALHRKSSRIEAAIDGFLTDIAVLPFDARCADEAGRIAATLAESGAGIGQIDTMIAAHALTLDLTLVTNNEKHFSRVPGLRIENWL